MVVMVNFFRIRRLRMSTQSPNFIFSGLLTSESPDQKKKICSILMMTLTTHNFGPTWSGGWVHSSSAPFWVDILLLTLQQQKELNLIVVFTRKCDFSVVWLYSISIRSCTWIQNLPSSISSLGLPSYYSPSLSWTWTMLGERWFGIKCAP